MDTRLCSPFNEQHITEVFICGSKLGLFRMLVNTSGFFRQYYWRTLTNSALHSTVSGTEKKISKLYIIFLNTFFLVLFFEIIRFDFIELWVRLYAVFLYKVTKLFILVFSSNIWNLQQPSSKLGSFYEFEFIDKFNKFE